jgi:hypothetical protein
MISLILPVLMAPVIGFGIPVDLVVAPGETAGPGDRYTVSYRVESADGREFADTDRRGLPYSKELADGHDGYLDAWVIGMSAGSVRMIFIDGSDVPDSMGDIVPAHTDLVVTLRLVAVRKFPTQ